MILVLGLVNACLFSGLLPLWEGFDEAFHYGYVETLWQTHRLPELGKTTIPDDVSRSFDFAPASYIVHRGIPQTLAYDEWFSLPEREKAARRAGLDRLVPASATSSSPNYEAHHPPLAYSILAIIDSSISKAAITTRVLVLRLFCAISSVTLLYFGITVLCQVLQLPPAWTNATLLTIFCSEMLYATVAHVANDWLAVGLSALFLAYLADFAARAERRSALAAAALLGAGLLTKAYFLAFAVLALVASAVLIWRGRARTRIVIEAAIVAAIAPFPWYARNLILYKNLSGTHEEFDGIGIRQALAAVPRVHWMPTMGFLARGSLWTGNNSFTDFSKATLNLVLLLLFIAVAAWGFRKDVIRSAETLIFGAIVLFSAAVASAPCASFAYTGGAAAGASPWYTQVLLTPVVALAYLGLSRWQRIGPVLAACTVAIWTWTLIATWVVKLFPLYSGAGAGPMHARGLRDWFVTGAAAHLRDLALLALAPPYLLYVGLLVSATLSILLSVAVIRALLSQP